MVNYKEFEVIRILLKFGDCVGANLAASVYQNAHYYVFKSEEEVAVLPPQFSERRAA